MHANDLFETITNQLIADIETGATGTWRMPWHTLADAGTPTSVDQRPYRGMNAVWLAMVGAAHGWTTGVYGTYRAWQRHDAQVRRGEKASQVVLWKAITPKDADNNDTSTGESGRTRGQRLFARAYAVFAAEQVDGADEIIARRTAQLAARDTPERIEQADRYFAGIAATVIEGGNRAYYRPGDDTIHLPALAQFDTAAHYYGTRAHETVHWTGHAERLNRDLTGRFGSDSYAGEELVAELGAAMWCAQVGLSAVTRSDHAAYLAGWLRILRSDASALVTVASRAQAAVDHLNTLVGHTTQTTDTDEAEAMAA
ncbi:MAG TPA: zincin-like metallopeptidase domain-containing protein [Ilumatobacter sp.]|nr:zincin-like metallopeptidase domain-containing protein [Ilumatobacter sp.]